jgi:hypothetical protein
VRLSELIAFQKSAALGSLVRIRICSRFVSLSKSVHKAPVKLTGATFPAFYPWASRAVEIENTTGRNFEELEGMLGNVKATVRIDYFSNAVAG